MHPILNIALRAARKAGSIMMRATENLDIIKVSEKAHNDFVTEVDHQAEKAIIEIIRAAYPDHAILAEESGQSVGSNPDEITWIIDPIDGTRNFIHGFAHFAVSIGVRVKGRVDHALIFDPVRQETFSATRGQGAQLNGKRIRVSKCADLKSALLGTGFPYKKFDQLKPYLKTLEVLMQSTSGIRRAGSAALDLAYIAAGRLDGFWEYGLAPWDIAAGALLIQEAGGMISDVKGTENYFETGDVVAGNAKLFKALLQTIHTNSTL